MMIQEYGSRNNERRRTSKVEHVTGAGLAGLPDGWRIDTSTDYRLSGVVERVAVSPDGKCSEVVARHTGAIVSDPAARLRKLGATNIEVHPLSGADGAAWRVAGTYVQQQTRLWCLALVWEQASNNEVIEQVLTTSDHQLRTNRPDLLWMAQRFRHLALRGSVVSSKEVTAS